MCYDTHERLAWIRRVEQVEKELKEGELAKAEAARRKTEGQQPARDADTRTQEEPVPA